MCIADTRVNTLFIIYHSHAPDGRGPGGHRPRSEQPQPNPTSTAENESCWGSARRYCTGKASRQHSAMTWSYQKESSSRSRTTRRRYSPIIVGRLLAISFASITDACCRAPNGQHNPSAEGIGFMPLLAVLGTRICPWPLKFLPVSPACCWISSECVPDFAGTRTCHV